MNKAVRIIVMTLLMTVAAGSINAFADDWILAAQKFTLPQQDVSSSSLEGVSTLLPQLILEQIVTGGDRVPSSREMLSRKTEILLTERNSLFVKLSAEVKKRDSILFTSGTSEEKAKSYEDSEKAIQEYQKQISENLEKTEHLKELYREQIEKEENSENTYSEETDSSKKKNINFFSLFGKKDEEDEIEIPPAEKIVLYKNDSYSLFVTDENTAEAGIKSREYAKAVTSQKIQGVLTGSIVMYGDYIAVTSELFMFPGAVSLGVITEVGTVADCVQIAESIASFFSPRIYTSMPVDVYIELEPPEARYNAKIAVDGYVYSSFPEKLRIRSGVHTIEVESRNYNKQTIVWNFKDTRSFLVHVSLTEKNNGELSVSMLMPYAGSYLVNGVFSPEEEPLSFKTNVTVNGQPALGYFMTEESSVKKVRKEVEDEKGNKKKVTEFEESGKIGAFFYIPEALMVPDSSLVVNIKPVDNVLEIDKRRIAMYRGYSALLCTLPVTFIVSGRSDALEKARLDPGVWKIAKYASIGVSVAAGGFFVYELVKYLKAAENVIPENARNIKSGEKEKLDALYSEYRENKRIEEEKKALEEKASEYSEEESEVTAADAAEADEEKVPESSETVETLETAEENNASEKAGTSEPSAEVTENLGE